MLCQLVCVDRRYQRMNCFNIRELQGSLKRRFFDDLVNSQSTHSSLADSMIGLRFKLSNQSFLDSSITNSYNFSPSDFVDYRKNEYESLVDAKQRTHFSSTDNNTA